MMTYKLANRVLEGMCGKSSMISSAIYIGLSTTAPARDGTGFTEPSAGAGYKRVLLGITAVIEKDKCFKKPIFELIAKEGSIPERDMYNTFNMGTGLVIAVDSDKADGNLLAYGSLTDHITPTNGTVPLIRAEELQMTLS